jgi:hypothetical protein
MEAHPDQALEIVVSWLSAQPRASIEQSWEAVDRKMGLGHLLLSALEGQAQWFKDRGNYDHPVPEFRRTLIPDYLIDVNPAAVTVRRSELK